MKKTFRTSKKKEDHALPIQFEDFFLYEICSITDFCLKELKRHRRNHKKKKAPYESVLHFQSILTQSSSLNRIFWPLKSAKSDSAYFRSTKLRKAFGLKNSDPLYKLKKIRDAIEHFDERLDNFFRESPNGLFHFCWINKPTLKLKVPQHTIRGLDIDKKELCLLNKTYNYGNLEKSLHNINSIASRMRKSGGRIIPSAPQPPASAGR